MSSEETKDGCVNNHESVNSNKQTKRNWSGG